MDGRGILVFLDDHFLNLWDFEVILARRGILVFLDDQMFESLGFTSNVGSVWNLGIF